MAGTAGIVGSIAAPPNSFGSVVVNGQLVGAQTSSGYFPKNYGGGITATPAGSPVTTPPNVGYGLSAGAASGAPVPMGSAPGGNTTNGTTSRGGFAGPFVGSPAMWAFGLMAFGLLWLRFVHWRKSPSKKVDE